MKHDIAHIHAREILDSRGLPTVEVELTLESGIAATGISPSGTSTGRTEAVSLRDHTDWYAGNGVSNAVANVNTEIARAIQGMDVHEQERIDAALCELDGTPHKGRLGGNAIIATSIAVLRAASMAAGMMPFQYLLRNNPITIPTNWICVFSGGVHSGCNLDFQEYLIAPVCAHTCKEYFQIAWQVFNKVYERLKNKNVMGSLFTIGAALAPLLSSNEESISLLIRSIEDAGYRPGEDVLVTIDVAASDFYKDGSYIFSAEKNRKLSSVELIDYWNHLCDKYPIYGLEDALDQEDWPGWTHLTEKIGSKVELIGDDFFTTNPDRIQRGIDEKAANAVLMKANQIGTVSEMIRAGNVAKHGGFRRISSTRSGESEDQMAVHLAIGLQAEEAKLVALHHVEHTGKINEFLRIEDMFGSTLHYGWK